MSNEEQTVFTENQAAQAAVEDTGKPVFQVLNGKIVNVTIQPTSFQPDGIFYVTANDQYGIGDLYDPINGEFTKFVPEPEPLPEPAMPVITDRQFFQQLAIMGLISESEAIAAVASGTLPVQFETMIESLPSEQRFNARILLSGATQFIRTYPLVEAFRQFIGFSKEQVDQLWIDAAKL